MNIVSKKREYLAMSGLLMAALIWGFAFIVVKSSVDTIPSAYMLAFRFTIASIGLCIIFHKKLKLINKEAIKYSVLLGGLLVFSYYLQTLGCLYTTAGKNAFLTTIYVIMVPFLQWLFYKKRPDSYCFTAGILAMIGIGLLSLNGDLSMNIGDILTLFSGLGYAIHMIYIDKYTKEQDPVLLTILQIIMAAIFSWLLAFITGTPFPEGIFEPSIAVSMLYLGLLSTMLGYLLQNVGQKYTEPSTTALLLSMESVFGVVFSSIFLKEVLTPKILLGCVIIFVAVIMAETKFDFIRKKKTEVNDIEEEFGETVS